jgi:hypothetical protein
MMLKSRMIMFSKYTCAKGLISLKAPYSILSLSLYVDDRVFYYLQKGLINPFISCYNLNLIEVPSMLKFG